MENREVPSMGLGRAHGDSVRPAYWFLSRHRAIEHLCENGCTIYRVGLPRMGFRRWCMQCHHTTHAICWKFRMAHLTSRTGQRLLAEASDVHRPVIVKQCYLWGCNQGQRPWQRAHQYLLVQKDQPYVTGQFLLLHILQTIAKRKRKIPKRLHVLNVVTDFSKSMGWNILKAPLPNKYESHIIRYTTSSKIWNLIFFFLKESKNTYLGSWEELNRC